MKAYVLVQTASEIDRPIAPALRDLTGVVLAEELRGRYDAIAVASSGSDGHPLDKIINEIRDLPGVTRAVVAPVVGSWAADRNGEAA
jgi:hypothetical protein